MSLRGSDTFQKMCIRDRYGIRVLSSLFLFQIIKFCGSNFLIGCIIDILHICRRLFLVLINDIFTGVSDLMYHIDLSGRLREYGTNGIRKSIQVVDTRCV